MPHLLYLLNELLEIILVFVCYENAQSIQACRQACRTLNATIVQSPLIQYLQRMGLLGMHDPFLLASSATLAPRDRAEALRAWEDAWNAFGGSDNEVFWRKRDPDLRVPRTPPLWPKSASSRSSPEFKQILATIIDPGPEPPVIYRPPCLDSRISLGPCFIVLKQIQGASYSYLDLHGCLGGLAGEGALGKDEEEDWDADFHHMRWTIIDIPLSNVVEIALSTDLDLAVVISCVFPFQFPPSCLYFCFLFVGLLKTAYTKLYSRGGWRPILQSDPCASGTVLRIRVPRC